MKVNKLLAKAQKRFLFGEVIHHPLDAFTEVLGA
jgi:hypothetical protein